MSAPPCLIFEDEHLLVVNKPPGWNTHSPAPFAGEGIYDWLRHREPRWERLAIVHRLDKETSGVLVFGKSPEANRSLTKQFTDHTIVKNYVLLTDRAVNQPAFIVTTNIARAGDHYASRPVGERAETRFRLCNSEFGIRTSEFRMVEAEPVTGRTHQIRVHAGESGFPVLGDTLYGGTPFPRVCLHARSLTLRHPASCETMTFQAPVDFAEDARLALRRAHIEPEATDAVRLIHGAPDGWSGWYVERLGSWLLSQSAQSLTERQKELLASWLKVFDLAGAFHKRLGRDVRGAKTEDASPWPVFGETRPDEVIVRENGVQFALRFDEGYSVGLFLDQRDNRRRLLTRHVAAAFEDVFRVPCSVNSKAAAQTQITEHGARSTAAPKVLNTFSYTCAFSVCAALVGARVTSVDLSKKYLEWGRRNFALNGLDAAAHEFLHGDVFEWLRRLAKKQRRFDVILLDPPTFSRSKEHGAFQAEKDFGQLVAGALPLLEQDGVLFCSTNAATLEPEKFLEMISAAVSRGGRVIREQHYVPQPPDFPVTRDEPAYLKTVWMRVR